MGEGGPDAEELEQQLMEAHEALQEARADADAAAAEAASARQQSSDTQVRPLRAFFRIYDRLQNIHLVSLLHILAQGSGLGVLM